MVKMVPGSPRTKTTTRCPAGPMACGVRHRTASPKKLLLEKCTLVIATTAGEEAIPTSDRVGDRFAALAVTFPEFSNSIEEGLAVR